MSQTIWGNPLFTSSILGSVNNIYDISDLNNWIRDRYFENVEIRYDSDSHKNTFSYPAVSGYEMLRYDFEVVPDTDYCFHAYTHLEYEEYVPDKTRSFVVVANALLNEKYIDYEPEKVITKSAIIPGRYQTHELWFNSGSNSMVRLYFDFCGVADDQAVQCMISSISCNPNTSDPIHYAQKPFNLNILDGDVWNFIAVEPGAWFYSIFDSRKTHHTYFLSGDEFKLLEFQDADGNGVIPHKEHHSTPITIEGKKYYALYLSRTVDSVCPFPTKYYPLDEMPTDEDVYKVLSKCVLEWTPYERGDVLGLLALRNLLSANSGDVNVDLDDVKALLKGYTVEERQNPYLDDPNLDDTGHPTVSFHD